MTCIDMASKPINIEISQEDKKNRSTTTLNNSRINITMGTQKHLELKENASLLVIPIKKDKLIIIKILEDEDLDDINIGGENGRK